MLVLAAAMLLASISAETSSSAAQDSLVCKTVKVADLGSNIRRPKRTCMRASDWRELEKLTERAKIKIFNGKTRGPGQPKPAGAGAGGGGGPE